MISYSKHVVYSKNVTEYNIGHTQLHSQELIKTLNSEPSATDFKKTKLGSCSWEEMCVLMTRKGALNTFQEIALAFTSTRKPN